MLVPAGFSGIDLGAGVKGGVKTDPRASPGFAIATRCLQYLIM